MRKINMRDLMPYLIASVILIGAGIYQNVQNRNLVKKYVHITVVPAPDPKLGYPEFYCIQTGIWHYSSGAKAPIRVKEPTVDLDKYLKKHIPIYRKKTYWGEEWDETEVEEAMENEGNH